MIFLITLLASASVFAQYDYSTWKSRYIKSDGDTNYVFANINGFLGSGVATVSEAHGYGMLLSVYNDDRTVFDGLVNYYQKFKNNNDFLEWRQHTQGNTVVTKSGDESSATDGDLDICLAFIRAFEKWGNVSFKKHAQNILKSLRDIIFTVGNGHPSLGDWVSSGSSDTITRPSDFLMWHFHEFSQFDSDNSQFWLNVVDSITTTLQDISNQFDSGLIPDFLEWNGSKFVRTSGQVLESIHDRDYYYNSCRIPWRLATLLVNKPNDPLLSVAQKMLQFFDSLGSVQSGYTLEGSPIGTFSDLAFIGPVSALAKVLLSNKQQMYLDSSESMSNEYYYADSLFLLAKTEQTLQNTQPTSTSINTPLSTPTSTSRNISNTVPTKCTTTLRTPIAIVTQLTSTFISTPTSTSTSTITSTPRNTPRIATVYDLDC